MFESVVSCRRAYLGKSIEVLDKVVRLPDDRVVHRDIVTYAGGAVCVVAVTTDNQVVLVRQYRPAPEKVMLEIPAGRRNVREHFLTAAKRELREETGYVASSWENVLNSGLALVLLTNAWPSLLRKVFSRVQQTWILTSLSTRF